MTTSTVPGDLVEFMRAGRELEYDVEGSIVGRITLKRADELAASTIETYPGCQSTIDDPYEELSGCYLVEVVDLVAESEDYSPEGLFCWIPALRCFGCVDAEHGDVMVFPGVSWTEIAADPLPFLEAQWAPGDSERALPWLHFPFRIFDSEAVIQPYAAQCPRHQAPVTRERVRKPALLEVMRRRFREEWLNECLATFPCSGVPVTEEEFLCCSACRQAEDSWIQAMDVTIPVLTVKPNEHGWIHCPGCGIRFSSADEHSFQGGRHWSCGQRLRLE